MCVVEWTYGGNVVLLSGYKEVLFVLVNGHMVVLCVDEWTYGGTMCVAEWTYGGTECW